MVNKLDEVHWWIPVNYPDIVVITETGLTSNVPNDLITIPGYKFIRKDRQNGQTGGGICTFFKNSTDYLHLQECEDPNFESQWF